MTIKISTSLQNLKQAIESITYQGDFLLSVNKFSHYWVYIDELWKTNEDSYDLIEASLKVVFQNLLAEHGAITVFSAGANSSDTGTTEEEIPMDKIANDSVKSLKSNSIKLLRVILDPKEAGKFQQYIPPGKCVGLFAFSLHIDLIKELVDNLRSRGSEVVAIVALIEREKVSRKKLSDLGVKLIPLIIIDEISGKPRTILEISESPYSDMHKYFRDPVKKTK